MNRPTVKQQLFGQCRLTRIRVRNDRKSSTPPDLTGGSRINSLDVRAQAFVLTPSPGKGERRLEEFVRNSFPVRLLVQRFSTMEGMELLEADRPTDTRPMGFLP